ncbi:sugar transport protein 8-like [Salvia miltiorrhiza]|uniref:sugar transport protein 8-like n=1 Tax=Salvia miltiorrhiza TaxID=226208 RepID=UPI0025ACEAE4|nr:sugar transport protein 8-like [Salvia miltiorrhiza]
MAPIIESAGDTGRDFPSKLTLQVVVCSLIAAVGGFMFGYDIGISGGVTSMDDFLLKFFHRVYEKKHRAREDNYCKFDDQLLQLFTSSLYLSAVVCCWVASFTCKRYGRKRTMQMAASFFFVGAALNAAAVNLHMLIAGRILLGAGVGFGNQAVPLFISEIAPAKHRGMLNICFQLLITVGILVANLINYWTSGIPGHGWRISLGLAAVPAVVLGLGSILISETPTSLVERGRKEEGLKSLRRIRGVDDVQKEFDEIVEATDVANQIKHPFRNLKRRSSWPMLFCSIALQIFQQFTGINVIMFYAPVLFQTMGLGSDAALMSAVITGCINSASTLVAVFGVDRFGRRKLLIQAAAQMLVSQVIVGVILQVFLKASNSIPRWYAYVVVALICVFVMGFAWSWGPLGWLIPSEIFPLETRTAGFFCAVSTNMIFTFIIAQAFLTMLCHMKAAIFFFFAAWIVVMGAFAIFLLPETKGIPIDKMSQVWSQHWFWRTFFDSLPTSSIQPPTTN